MVPDYSTGRWAGNTQENSSAIVAFLVVTSLPLPLSASAQSGAGVAGVLVGTGIREHLSKIPLSGMYTLCR